MTAPVHPEALAKIFVPLKQGVLHRPDDGMFGDCHRTAVAMLLGVPRDDVPHWCDENNPHWKRDRDAWLNDRFGLALVEWPVQASQSLDDICHFVARVAPRVPFIINGISPRDTYHSCVIFDGQVFDPHPDDTGLCRARRDGWWRLESLSPLYGCFAHLKGPTP